MDFDRRALARIRAARALSLRELAEKAGMAEGAVWRLESGVTKRPHPSTMRKLSAALGIEPTELMLDIDNAGGGKAEAAPE